MATSAEGTRSDADANSEYVKGDGDSDSDLEKAPTVFGSGGFESGAEAQPGTSIIGPTTRIFAGANYSLSGLYRGIAMRSAADADCRRYQSVSELHAFLDDMKNAHVSEAQGTGHGFSRPGRWGPEFDEAYDKALSAATAVNLAQDARSRGRTASEPEQPCSAKKIVHWEVRKNMEILR